MRHRLLAGALCALAACSTTTSVVSSTTTAPPTTSSAVTTTTAPPATSGPTTTANSFPVTVGSVTIPSRPSRIVSLAPTTTEMLFAIGAGPQVVAVDDQSNYPPDAPHSKLSGYQPNIEAIAAYNPDLVVVSNDLNGVVAGLKTLKIPVLVELAASTLDDSYREIIELGDATGNGANAADEVASMKEKIASIVASVPSRPLHYYLELDNTYYSVTSKTFIGALYSLIGLVNIADAADKQGSGYPQLSAEYIVHANPDVIFLADTKCCQENAASVAARPGWSTLSAVRDGSVVALDDDIASRWGPRTPDLLAAVATAVSKVP